MARKIKKAGFVKQKPKEPGIPNLFPYKERMIEQLENKERQDQDSKKLAKQLRKRLRKDGGGNDSDEGKDEIETYIQQVNSKIIR